MATNDEVQDGTIHAITSVASQLSLQNEKAMNSMEEEELEMAIIQSAAYANRPLKIGETAGERKKVDLMQEAGKGKAIMQETNSDTSPDTSPPTMPRGVICIGCNSILGNTSQKPGGTTWILTDS